MNIAVSRCPQASINLHRYDKEVEIILGIQKVLHIIEKKKDLLIKVGQRAQSTDHYYAIVNSGRQDSLIMLEK